MRIPRFLRFVALAFLVLLALPLVACSTSKTVAPLVARPVARASAYDCAPAARQPRAVAPAYELAIGDPTGVVYVQGPAESARAALQLPGSIVECGGVALGEGAGVVGRFLRCVGGKLADPLSPPPSVRYLYGPTGAAVEDGCGCGGCGVPGPAMPPPAPPPSGPADPNGDVPESIPAIRRK